MRQTFDVGSDGCHLTCRVEGLATGPPLLLLHSLGTTTDLWAPQMAVFSAAGHRVIRYDTRGHGSSAVPPGEYTIDQLGRDALAVLDTVGVERAHICGLSLGGVTAMWLGAEAPQRVATLVLASTAARVGSRAHWDERIRQVETAGLDALADGAMTRWFTEAFRMTHPYTVANYRHMLATCPPEGYIGCCAVLRDTDLRERLARIDAPTLVISGTDDPATPPADGAAICAGVRGARLITLDASHLANVEQPERFSEGVLTFINEKGPFHG